MAKSDGPVSYEASNRQWYEAIGEFVVKFEHMCQEARLVIAADLNTDNTSVSAEKAYSVIATLSAKQLGDAITMILRRTGRLETTDDKMLGRYLTVCDRRNTIVHSAWFIGWGSDPAGPDDPYNVTAMGPSRSVKSERALIAKTLSIQEVREAIIEVAQVQVGLMQILRHTPPFQQTPLRPPS